MDLSGVVLAAATVGLIVNTLTVLGVSWKGGHFMGDVNATLKHLFGEVRELRLSREEEMRQRADTAQLMARVTYQVEQLEMRVRNIEVRPQ